MEAARSPMIWVRTSPQAEWKVCSATAQAGVHSSGGETPEESAWQWYGRLCTDHCLQQSVSVSRAQSSISSQEQSGALFPIH